MKGYMYIYIFNRKIKLYKKMNVWCFLIVITISTLFYYCYHIKQQQLQQQEQVPLLCPGCVENITASINDGKDSGGEVMEDDNGIL